MCYRETMKNLRLLILIVQILLLHLLSVSSSVRDVTMSLQGTDLCPTTFLNLEVKGKSRVQCMGICFSQHTCSGICHNANERICRTFSSFVSEAKTGAVFSRGFNMYWLEYLDEFSRFGQKAYKYLKELQTNANAQLRCQEMNATLALPMNPDEGRDILILTSKIYVWINLNDELNEGIWVSGRTGEPVSNINWLIGQPVGSINLHCGYLIATNEIAQCICSVPLWYVCERLVYGSY